MSNRSFPGYPLTSGGRAWLLAASVLLVAGFALARSLEPDPRGFGTHQRLGLPECTFKEKTGMPCPSCGMTSSFSLFVRGDFLNSIRANWVGTLMASVCLWLIPWCLASVYFGRPLFVRSIEMPISMGIIVLLSLLLIRWVIVLLIQYCTGTPATP